MPTDRASDSEILLHAVKYLGNDGIIAVLKRRKYGEVEILRAIDYVLRKEYLDLLDILLTTKSDEVTDAIFSTQLYKYLKLIRKLAMDTNNTRVLRYLESRFSIRDESAHVMEVDTESICVSTVETSAGINVQVSRETVEKAAKICEKIPPAIRARYPLSDIDTAISLMYDTTF